MSSRIRRTILGLFVFLLLGVLILHTSGARRLAKSVLSRQLTTELSGIVTIGELDYRLWSCEIDISQFRWEAPSLDLTARDIKTKWRPFRGIEIHVTEPQLTYRRTELRPSRPPSAPSLPTTLAELAIRNGELRVADQDGKLQLQLESVDVDLLSGSGDHKGTLTAVAGNVAVSREKHLTFGPVQADFTFAPETLTLTRLLVEKGSSSVGANGTITSFDPLMMELALDYRVGREVADELVAEIEVTGEVQGQAQLFSDARGLHGNASFQSTPLDSPFTGTWSIEGDLALEGSELEISRIQAAGYDGTVQLTGHIDLEHDNHTLEASISGLDLERLSHIWVERPLPIASSLNGQVQLALQGPSLANARGRARIQLTRKSTDVALPLSGDVEIETEAGEILLRSNLAIPSGELSFNSRARAKGSVQATYEAHIDDLRRLHPLLDTLQLPEILGEMKGSVSFRGQTVGSWRDPSALASQWTITSNHLDFRDAVFSLESRVDVSGPLGDLDIDTSSRFHPIVINEAKGEGTLIARKRGRFLFFERLEATMGEGSAIASATYHLDTNELEVELEARQVPLSKLFPATSTNRWSGVASSVNVEVAGQFPKLAGRATMSLDDIRLHRTELPSLVITAQSDSRRLRMECHSEDSQRIAMAAMELEHPYPIEGSVDLSVLPIDLLLRGFFPTTPDDTRLRARGRLEVTLPLAHAEKVSYRAQVEQLVGQYRGVGGGTGSLFTIEGDRDSLRIDGLDLVGTDTAIAVHGTIPLSMSGSYDLKLMGNARLELFNQFLEAGELEGEASLDLHIVGSRDLPDPRGELRVEKGSVAWGKIRASDLALVVDVHDRRALVERFSGALLGGTFQLSGESPLPRPSTDRPARFDFEVEDIDLAELTTSTEDSALQPLALVSTNGTIEASGLEFSRIRGSGNLVSLLASLGDIIIENDEPCPWRLDDNKLIFERMHAVGGDTELEVKLVAEHTGEQWKWRSTLQGALDNVFLNPLLRPRGAAIGGTTSVELQIEGTDAATMFQGSGQLEGARLVFRDPPLALSEIKGKLQFAQSTMTLSEIKADVGGGTVEGYGEIEIGNLPEIAGLDIYLRGDSVRFNYPDGMRSRIGGDLRLRGTSGAFLLSGDIRLEEGSFERDITIESELLSSIDRQRPDFSKEPSFATDVMLDIRAQSVNDIRIDNNLAQLQARANLRISGTLENPEMDGTANARPDGKFRLGRNLYRIEAGSILFRGYPSEPAELDVSARTEVTGVDILVRLRGPIDDITMELSAPHRTSLSQGDIASLLVTGRTLANVSDLESISGQERRILGEQLASYLSGTFTSLVRQGLGNALPFDTIAVGPSTLEADVSPEIRFSIGKAVTEDLSITYSIGLEDVRSQLWMLDYRLPKRLAFRLTRKGDNEFTGRLSQQLEFDFPGRPSRTEEGLKRTKVAEMNVVGGPADLEDQLLKRVHMRSGESFDYWKSQEDVARLMDFLKEHGHLNASVESRWTPTNEAEGSLTYLIEAGSPISIRWTGDDPGASVREDVLNRWDGRFPISFLLPDLTASVSQRLMHERYFEADVTANVEDDPEGTRTVVFDVRRGTRGRTLTLDFEGNQALSNAELLKALPSTSSLDFIELLQNPERFRERVRLVYFGEGYIRARIGSPEMDFSKTTGSFHVTIPVEEGPIAVVEEIAFEGLSSFDDATLRRQLTLTEGRPFRFGDYSEDRSTMTRLFRREGFTSARVKGRLDGTETALRIVYTIEEGQRQKIGDITIVGNHVTHESTIRRELTFRRNDPLRLSDLAETQQRLYELGAFRSVDMRTEARAEDFSTTDVVVRLDETPDVNFGYGLRYSTEDRFEVLTGLHFPSLFGSAHRAGLTLTVNANESVVRGSYSLPYFWRYELGTEFFVSRETEDAERFSDETWRFTFQQHKRLLDDLALQWSYTYEHNHILGKVTDDSPFPFDFTTRESILTTSFIEDRRNNFIQPTSGRFASVTFQTAPKALGSDVKFIKLFGRLNTFFSLKKDWIWAASYRIGIADAFDEFLLPDNRFTAGGATTVRGFEQDSLGPTDPIAGTVVGGEGLVVFNQELRFPIYRWFQGVAFYDAGNVFLNASDFRLFDLRHSAGAGLRVVLPFGLLRFDYAWVLDRQPGEKSSQFWFNLNHAF